VLQRKLDLTGILATSAPPVFFIDEIHRLLPTSKRCLYSALEDFVSISWSASGRARAPTSLPIAEVHRHRATTRQGLVSAPLRGRFGLVLRLDPYNVDELKTIVNRSARLLSVEIEDGRRGVGPPLSRHTAYRQPPAAPRPRLCAGARRWPHHAAGGADCPQLLDVDRFGLDEIDRRSC